MKSKINVLTLMFLIFFLTGCNHSPIRPTIPQPLLERTDYMTAREVGVKTYGDVIDTYIPYLKSQIESCNADKDAIVTWEKEVEK